MYHDNCIHSRLAIYLLGRPLRKLRESFIESLPPDEADKEFSPCILKVMSAEPGRRKEEELHAMKQHICRRSPSKYPLLVWSLFSCEDDDATLLPRSFDLSLLAKLERLPQIVGTLRKLANEDTAALHLDQPACVLLQRLGRDEALAFEEAWEVCRYGQRFECQAVEDLGPLEVLCAKDLLLMDADGKDGMSCAMLLLRNLVDAHNAHVELLLPRDTALNISVYLVDPDKLAGHLVPWGKARTWLHENILILPQRESTAAAAKDMESVLRIWLQQTVSLVKLSLEDWPLTKRVPTGVVRLNAEDQSAALPHECIAAIDEFFRQYGLLRDKVCVALEILNRIAAWVHSSADKISPETWLQDKLFGSKHPPHSSLLDIFKGKRLGVRLKHLNALQDHLCERIEAKAEDHLGAAYRTPLDDEQSSHLETEMIALSAKKEGSPGCRLLLRKLSGLAERLARDAHPPDHGVLLYRELCARYCSCKSLCLHCFDALCSCPFAPSNVHNA